MNRTNRAAVLLLIVGLLQMTGDLLEQYVSPTVGQPIKAVGAASTASPAPKVFSAVRGLETYSTRFYLEWTDRAGQSHSLELTPEVYSRLEGPYNRRNIFGAALAYGPVLATNERTRPMFQAVLHYALCDEAPVLRELGVDPAQVASVRVRYEPLPGTDMGGLPRMLEAPCR